MRRYSPPYYSPPRRSYGGGRGRSPPRRGYGGNGGRREQSHRSLLVRNIPMGCRAEDLRVPFERFGPVRDVYLPKDYYTGEPRGFAFVEYINPFDASEAQHHMNRRIFGGREITVVAAAETRKRPEEMRTRSGPRGPSGSYGRRSSYHGRRHSRSVSRSRSPYRPSNSRAHRDSKSYSPEPRRRDDPSLSPKGRQTRSTRSPRDYPRGADDDRDHDSYSGDFAGAEHKTENGYSKKSEHVVGESRSPRRSPRRRSRSISSTSRSPVNSSPRRSR